MELNTRDFMVGNIVLACLGGVCSKKGMITEIYKDKVKVMDWETKKEEVIPPNLCFGINITSDLLVNVLGFEKHTVNKLINALKTEKIEEWIKVISDSEDPNKCYFLTFPSKVDPNDPWILEITDMNKKMKSSIPVTNLHELQNQVYFQTKLVLC